MHRHDYTRYVSKYRNVIFKLCRSVTLIHLFINFFLILRLIISIYPNCLISNKNYLYGVVFYLLFLIACMFVRVSVLNIISFYSPFSKICIEHTECMHSYLLSSNIGNIRLFFSSGSFSILSVPFSLSFSISLSLYIHRSIHLCICLSNCLQMFLSKLFNILD